MNTILNSISQDEKNKSFVTIYKDGAEFNIKISDFIGAPASSYKVYTALLTQTGTNPPVATVLENTIGAITFSYTEPGKYNVNSSGLFTISKMVLITTAFGKDGGGGFANDIRFRNTPTLNTSSLIPLETLGPGGLINDALYNTPIEIRVYN